MHERHAVTPASVHTRSDRLRDIETTILAQTSDAVIAIDSNYQVTYWNPAAETIYGIRAADALGQPLQSLYTFEWSNPAEEQRALAELRDKGIWRGENVHIRRDGTRIYAHSTVNVLPDSSHGGLLAVVRDISDRKVVELDASRERTFLDALTGVAPVLIYIYDLVETRNVYINEALPSILGYSAAELSEMGGALLETLLHPEDAQRYISHYAHLRGLRDGETVVFEYRMRHKTGSWVWLCSHERVFRRNEQGNVTQIVGAAQDTTLRRMAEEERANMARLLTTIVESTTDLVWVKDTADRMTFANKACLNLLGGGDWHRVIGLDARALVPDPAQASHILNNDARIMRNGVPERVREEFGPPSQPMVFQSTKAPLRDASGAVIGLVGVSRDVTEETRAQHRLGQNEERQRYLLKLSDALRPVSDPVEIQTVASRLLGEHLQANRVLYAEIENDEATVHRDYVNGVPSIAGKFHVWNFGDTVVNTYLSGGLINQPDIAHDPSLSPSARSAFAAINAASNLSRGLLKNGKWVAALTVHHATPRVWTELEIAIFDETAERTWDAVQRARAEQELQRALHRADIAQRAASSALFEICVSTGDVVRSPFMLQLLGYSVHDLAPSVDAWRRIVHPEDLPRLDQALRATVEDGSDFKVEYRVRHKDGHWVWVADHAQAIRNQQGQVDRIVGLVSDVTARRNVLSALEESEFRFRQLAENMSQFAWMARPDGHIFWYNRRWFEYTGTTLHQMEGWGWRAVHHPDYVNGVVERISRAFSSGEPWEDTFPLRGADGTYRWFLSRAVPIRDNNGKIVRWFGTNTDITHQLDIEAELRRANEDLEQFAYSVSHDLREPLRNVAAFSQLLERDYIHHLDANGIAFIHQIVAGAQRMSNLIADLLAYSRAAAADDTSPEITDTNETLKTVLGNLGQSIRETGAQITTTDLPPLYVRPAHLECLFQNLIGNALNYRREGEPPRIHIQTGETAGLCRFSISDNGIGIAPEYHHRIFGVFKRLHSDTRKYPGTGVGLAICQRIVERYGGRIWVESQPGDGSTFHFTLPQLASRQASTA